MIGHGSQLGNVVHTLCKKKDETLNRFWKLIRCRVTTYLVAYHCPGRALSDCSIMAYGRRINIRRVST